MTFLFTDIEGSSDLAQRDPDAFPALLARHHAILRQVVEGHQLRAALSLGHLWRSQGKTEDARRLVGEAYERLSEGFATADLQDAKSLLDDLAG